MPATPPKLELLRRRFGPLTRWEPALYALVAGAATLYVATRFAGSTRLQTLYATYWANPELFGNAANQSAGPWSAPLDDVFIHFDFARSTARGHPFEWCTGNGYSSGATSLLYPFVLAIGHLSGFRGLSLMEWALIVACVAVFALLLAARRAFRLLPTITSYLLPAALLGIGALSWSLFSGMEIAFFLCLWAGAFVSWDKLNELAELAPPRSLWLTAAGLGAWGAALVATRPEALATVLVFAMTSLFRLRSRPFRVLLGTVALIVVPPALIVSALAVANLYLTGDAAAAGAIAKLELYHPFLTTQEKIDLWWFYLGYQALRITQQHLESIPAIGWLVWVFGVAALYFRETRRVAVLLWSSVLTWAMTVALNGQVRWQNERYVMPAVAWLMLAAALGASACLARGFTRPRRRWGVALAALTAVTIVAFSVQAAENFRFQAWYFGRASRNIFDQHVSVGRMLHDGPQPQPLVMVGDAGAIPYMSDGPTLDLIGLGGYKGLPFARATRANVSAAVELIERLPNAERPQLLALYPSWWDEFPIWFGSRVAEVSARGNVICGAPSKVIYRAEWGALDGSSTPFSLVPGERVVAEFDWADVVSETAGHYQRFPDRAGRIAPKLLPHPNHPEHDVFDAGRNTPAGHRERFVMTGIVPGRPVRLVVRAAPVAGIDVPVSIDGEPIGTLRLPRTDGWVERSVAVPPRASSTMIVDLGTSGERVLYHAWALERP